MPSKVLSAEHQAFIDALFETKGNVAQAAVKAGYADTYGYTLVKLLRENIMEAAENIMALHSPRAVFTLVDGMAGELPLGANNQIESAKQILDRVGLVKKEKVELSGNVGGIFLFPEKRND